MALTKVKINLGTQGNLSGSRSIIQSTKTLVSSSAQIASNISGSFTSTSSSIASDIAGNLSSINTLNGSGAAQGVGTSDSPTFNNITATGTLTAQEIHTEFTSASILFTSGSTKFGNSLDDNHVFSGSLLVTGSLVQLRGDSTKLRFSNDAGAERAFLQLNGTGLNIDTDSFIDFKPNNTFTARFDSNGRLGIGTNNPGSNLVVSSSTKTDVLVGGNSSVFSDNGRSNLEINGSGTSTLGLTIGGAAKGLLFHDGTDSYFRNYANGYFAIYTNNAEKVRVDNSGNVGIGNTVASTINSANNGGRLVVGNGSGNDGMTIYSGNGSSEYGVMYFADGTSGASTYQGWIAYYHDTNQMSLGTAGDHRVRITASGNVGIGTNSPSDQLTISNSGEASVAIIGSAGVGGGDATLYLVENTTDYGIRMRYDGGDDKLYINADEDTRNLMTIERDGTGVGIGTTSPSATLAVNGTLLGGGQRFATSGKSVNVGSSTTFDISGSSSGFVFVKILVKVGWNGNASYQMHSQYNYVTCNYATTGGESRSDIVQVEAGNAQFNYSDFSISRPSDRTVRLTYAPSGGSGSHTCSIYVSGVFDSLS